MTSAGLGAIGAIAGAVGMIIVFLLSRKHREHVEDQEAESSHVTAISAASETLAAAVNVLIEPLNNSIIRLQERERDMAIEMTKMKAELAVVKADHRRMHRDFEALVRYVQMLWHQIKQSGVDPVPPPEELSHVVWDGDSGPAYESPEQPI